MHERPEVAAWGRLVDALRDAGAAVETGTEGLDAAEQADGFRSLLRALANQLGRFEVDRDQPEMVPFNGWRQKLLMDNPDIRYWIADVRADRSYRIVGDRGDASYVSITAYTASGATDASAAARLDDDSITTDEDGRYVVDVGGERPPSGAWLELPEGTSSIWVRHFHDDVQSDRHGGCRITASSPVTEQEGGTAPDMPAGIDPGRFVHRLDRLASTTAALPGIMAAAAGADLRRPNVLRRWSEMTGGAVFTEPGIEYLRGGWRLEPDEALVVEGTVPECRWWNVLLYSRFLNSLDHRHRPVSATGATATLHGDRYRFVLSAADPGAGVGHWLDTEGRPEGTLVMRFLRPTVDPVLPATRVVPLAQVGPWR